MECARRSIQSISTWCNRREGPTTRSAEHVNLLVSAIIDSRKFSPESTRGTVTLDSQRRSGRLTFALPSSHSAVAILAAITCGVVVGSFNKCSIFEDGTSFGDATLVRFHAGLLRRHGSQLLRQTVPRHSGTARKCCHRLCSSRLRVFRY